MSALAEKCISFKKEIDKKYILNGAEESPLILNQSINEALQNFIVEEVTSYCKILINESLIDRLICEIYELNENDLKRVTAKKGGCAAFIPVYSEAIKRFIDEYGIDNDYIENLKTVQYRTEEIHSIKERISAGLFSQNNEMEDFCCLNDLNPITVWYFIKYEGIIPFTKARNLVFEWFVFAIRDILNETQDGIISITSTDMPILELLESYADKKGIISAQLLQMEMFLGKKIRDFVEKDFFNELMNYTNVFMYLPKTPFIWHLSSGENRGFEAFILIYKWNVDSIYKLKSTYISKRREKLEFRKTQLANSNTAQAIDEKELIDKQLKEIEIFVIKIDELIAQGYNPTLDDGVGKNIAPLQNRKMLKADVLNVNQLEKYLKAEW